MEVLNYTLRKMREEDLPKVSAMENATQVVPWTDKIFKDCFFAGYPGWVMEYEKEVVSFSIFSLHGDECHLLNICVHPNYQRRGLGSQMLLHAIDSAKKLGAMMIYLEVRESNAKAIALYRKLGFTQIHIRKDYYPALDGRENAFVYAKDLGVLSRL